MQQIFCFPVFCWFFSSPYELRYNVIIQHLTDLFHSGSASTSLCLHWLLYNYVNRPSCLKSRAYICFFLYFQVYSSCCLSAILRNISHSSLGKPRISSPFHGKPTPQMTSTSSFNINRESKYLQRSLHNSLIKIFQHLGVKTYR